MPNTSLARITAASLALTALLAAAHARAADFGFQGNIVMNNDLVNVDFTVAGGAGTVKLWTDSFQSGVNFDPDLALWQKSGNDYVLVTFVKDDNSIAPAQGYQDSGISTSLAAGSYKLTLSASSYQPVGTKLSQGYEFDPFFIPALQPTPIATWDQPSYDPNLDNQKGGFWSVHVSGAGVQSASIAAVPEPSTVALMLGGLTAVAWMRRRRQG